MFEEQYNELWLALDAIAERIRALGFPAPGTYTQYAKLSSIKETEGVQDLSHRRQVERRADRGPAHAAYAGARENRLDAALIAGGIDGRHRTHQG
jgi:hypothetical protein